ncbi:alpha/beta hydrolase [Paecilomyces variotii No. 5]|uniref:Alpha/beta hydrolase n=1 Tax=Byssochlamys spectabilis (strain No. 5 / NBRC 109023) TaxID=1356009 RepID=V5FEF3_BYSSN|nr:alpha/beta hydrolase [Paecilomyces variotii No. 5]
MALESTSISAVLEVGDGVPVLFVHGWEMNGHTEALDYEPIFSSISGYRRIYVDLPGMGSTPADQIDDLDGVYRWLVNFIDERIGTSRFLIIGSSCGAYLARALAQQYTAQVDGLLLRVPLIEPDDSKRDLDPFRPLVQDDQLMNSVLPEERTRLGDVLIQTPAYLDALKQRFDVGFSASESANKEVLDKIRNDKQRYRLSVPIDQPFGAPTLIVAGRQDESVGYRDSRRLLEQYSRSTYVVLDRGRHPLPIDDPERKLFEALVRDWLYRVNEWRTFSRPQSY